MALGVNRIRVDGGATGRIQCWANEFASSEWSGEQLGQFPGLIDAMNGTKDQFNRPLGGNSFCFERIGKSHAADHKIGLRGTDAIQLFFNMLSFHDRGALREKR